MGAPLSRSRGRLLFMADASSPHAQRWVGAMADRGFDCAVLTRRPAALPGAQWVKALRPGADAKGWWLALPAVRRLTQAWGPDLVHGHYLTSYGLWAACNGSKRPLVQTAWGSDVLLTPKSNRWMRQLVAHNLRAASLVTADSNDALQAMRDLGCKAPSSLVLWGVDGERLQPGTPDTDFTVLSLRAWEDNYNIDVILQACAALQRRLPQRRVRLLLLGGGTLQPSLRSLAVQLGLADSAVEWHGRVDASTMMALMQRAHVSVSVPSSDATSVSLLESMACGLPVVVSDLPANRDCLRGLDPRVAAWHGVVPPRSVDGMVEALARIATHPQEARAAGLAGREQVLAVADAAKHWDHMATLYDALLQRGTA